GKSTILRLIAGLYTPERGSVRVFGRTPRKVAREVAYLPQVAHLFEGSIRQNLSLLSDASAEKLELAAEQSGLAAFVATLPMGYETILPAGGSTLSGGQRQLIMWTAAMASGRRLLLLDESLSQVDRVTRSRLLAMCDQHACTIVSVDHEPLTRCRLASNDVQELENAPLSRDPFESQRRSSGVVTQLIQETRYGD
ncbi:MAG TPA: ATP-binding cassette domain-containing protein, partial [Polyangiales bacterium]